MIIIFESKEEGNFYRDKCQGSSVLRGKYFNCAHFINSYMLGSYRTADYVIKELERKKNVKHNV